MEAVLGLSMTPTTVGLVLVEGHDADGPTMDKDEFAVHDRGLVSAVNTSEKAAAAVLRSEAVAAARGHRLHSIGVTWSEDADTEASLLLESLSQSGFDNVVAVRLPEATEALARGVASVIGYEITAVCVIEADAVVAMVVDTAHPEVQTAVSHSVATDEDLARWLSSVFAQAAWQPEALVLVGSGSDLTAITPHLEDVLAVPVFVPAEAQLALARGAAMASAHGTDFFLAQAGRSGRVPTHASRPSLVPRIGAAGAMLAVGVVGLVVSGSLAIGLQLTAGESANPAENASAARNSDVPTALKAIQPAPAAPAPTTMEAIPPAPPPEELPPPPEELPPPQEAAIEPVPVAEPAVPEAPAPEPLAPPVDGSAPQGVLAPNGVPLPPGVTDPAPGLVPAPVTPVPEEKPGILRRLKDKLSGIGQPDPPQGPVDGVQAPVDGAPPPQAAVDGAPPPQAPVDGVPPPQDPLMAPPPPPEGAPPPPPPG
ncbi:hypothetical protein MAGR_01490 [Mycolicibacterium agri]|uniref:DUF7159 domain-containing protein n=2 Tax=Mycolicibacterium agri TaxID=36811 RepID=A0A7I9VU98_MYCAG|nr:hypothetical protein MAGR_01490 [Mycolicibacterium agri]